MSIVVYGDNIIAKEIIKYAKEFEQQFGFLKDVEFILLKPEDLKCSNPSEINAYFIDNFPYLFINCNFVNDNNFCEENEQLSYKLNVSNTFSLNFYANLNKVPIFHIVDFLNFSSDDEISVFKKQICELITKIGTKSSFIQFSNIFSSLSEDESIVTSILKDVLCGDIKQKELPEENISVIYAKTAVEEIYKNINYYLKTNKYVNKLYNEINFSFKQIYQIFDNYKNQKPQFLTENIRELSLVFNEYQLPVYKIGEIKPITGNFLSYLALDDLFYPVLIDNEQ